jgi:uncharacterized iron-regulated protein
MITIAMRLNTILALAVFCTSCGAYGHNPDVSQIPASVPNPDAIPKTVDVENLRQIEALAGQLADKRVIFIGEVHDRLEHHQNQLRIIQALYARNHELSIGVEYFQKPFQPYLDDYIAGRISEREMLVKTEYFKRWQLDYRMVQPIFAFAREKHIPVLALNVPDEIHNKVFREGMKSLNSQELAQTPSNIQPASQHYLKRLKSIFDSHPTSNDFETFVEGVLLWDQTMADNAANYLKSHPHSRMVVLAGMVHVMYGDGIPERVDRLLDENKSVVLINGSEFRDYPGIADFQLATNDNLALPKAGKLGISIDDGSGSIRIVFFTPDSAAQAKGITVGDRIIALNGVKVASIPELKSILFDKQPGDRIQLSVQRESTSGSESDMQFDVLLR